MIKRITRMPNHCYYHYHHWATKMCRQLHAISVCSEPCTVLCVVQS